jgi:hypothetical protein
MNAAVGSDAGATSPAGTEDHVDEPLEQTVTIIRVRWVDSME